MTKQETALIHFDGIGFESKVRHLIDSYIEQHLEYLQDQKDLDEEEREYELSDEAETLLKDPNTFMDFPYLKAYDYYLKLFVQHLNYQLLEVKDEDPFDPPLLTNPKFSLQTKSDTSSCFQGEIEVDLTDPPRLLALISSSASAMKTLRAQTTFELKELEVYENLTDVYLWNLTGDRSCYYRPRFWGILIESLIESTLTIRQNRTTMEQFEEDLAEEDCIYENFKMYVEELLYNPLKDHPLS
jgi:hypothetical protein